MTKEIWMPVAGFERHYIVSNRGRVKRISKTTRTECKFIGFAASHGYRKVTFTTNGVEEEHYIHRLVAIAFLPFPSPDHIEVNHIDGVRSNNYVSNLEWVTRTQNLQHRSRVLGKEIGINHHGAKLPPVSIYRIRQMIAEG